MSKSLFSEYSFGEYSEPPQSVVEKITNIVSQPAIKVGYRIRPRMAIDELDNWYAARGFTSVSEHHTGNKLVRCVDCAGLVPNDNSTTLGLGDCMVGGVVWPGANRSCDKFVGKLDIKPLT